MHQTFSKDIAIKYGIVAALLMEHIWHEICENEFHQRNCFEEQTWMRCCRKNFHQRFPYLNPHTINRGIRCLIREGVIDKGEFNPCPFDHTLWYKVTPFGRKLMIESEDL